MPGLVAALQVVLCAAAVCPQYVNHDAAWYLHMAHVWLDGATLYRDVVDTNPPLIVFLTAIPVYVARVVHVTEPAVFKAFVFGAAGISTFASISLIRRIVEDESSRAVLTVLLVFLLFPFTKGDFGQREHLTVLLVLPYVLATAAWAVGRPSTERIDLMTGVVAGLGFAMKPYFVLTWLVIESCVFLVSPRSRSVLRPASIGVAATLLVYTIIVMVFVPHYLDVARGVIAVYGGLNAPPSLMLRLPDFQLWTFAALLLALVRLPARQRTPCLVLFAAATGFLVAAVLQLKGWSYHLYPCRVFLLMVLGTAIVGLADAHPTALDVIRGGRRNLVAAVLAAVSIWSVRYLVEARRPLLADLVTPLANLVRNQQADSLALLSMGSIVYPAFPTVNYVEATWVMRHHSLWFLPGLYDDELRRTDREPVFRSIEQMTTLEHQYFEQVIEDLCRRPPRLLVVEPPILKAPVGRRAIDLVAYYRQDERFDRLFAAYKPSATIGQFVAYSRETRSSCAPR